MPVRLILLAALVACGGGDDAGPPEVTLGTGVAEFEPLADGDSILVTQGPQGGFHVLGSVITLNLEPGNADDLSDPRNPTVEFRLLAGNQRVDAQVSTYTQGLDPGFDGAYQMIGRLVILDITSDDELDGTNVRFEVEVTDADGASASDARNLVTVPDPNNL